LDFAVGDADRPMDSAGDTNNPPDLGDDVAVADDMGAPLDGGNLPAGWTTLTSLPAPQQEIAVVALDGLIYVMGGFSTGAAAVATTVAYDPSTDTWSSRADFPLPANHMNASVVDGQIWVTGFLFMGFTADERTFVYDPADDAWTPGPDMPPTRGRGSSAAGVIDGLVYVAGGLAPGGGSVAWTDALDPVTGIWTELSDAPRAFDHMGNGVVDGKLIVAAGRNGGIYSFVDSVHIYDPQTGEWTDAAPIPTARGGVASAVLNDVLYVFGGEGDQNAPGQVFDDVEAYDLATDSWSVLEPMKTPRHGFGGAASNGAIYLPGGAPVQIFGAIDVMEAYVP
jgi:N-acetylneuraminic acid mutarotase